MGNGVKALEHDLAVLQTVGIITRPNNSIPRHTAKRIKTKQNNPQKIYDVNVHGGITKNIQ